MDEPREQLLQFFEYAHLPTHLQKDCAVRAELLRK
jgi:hypothetical protein